MPRNGTQFRFALGLLALIACLVASRVRGGENAQDEGGMGALLGEGFDFKGGMLDWEEDAEGRKVAVLRNYATIILPQVTISARNMVINVEAQEIYAEGDVVFTEKSGTTFYCDQITFNYPEWRGLALNVRIKIDNSTVNIPTVDFLDESPSLGTKPDALGDAGRVKGQLRRFFVQAGELRIQNKDLVELIDAKITPSAFAKPHWYFHAPAALYRRDEKVESYHNKVKIGKVPVFYFPYLIRDLQYDWPWMRILVGFSSDWGLTIKTKWGWQLNPDPKSPIRFEKIYLDVDWYNRRGLGTGVELLYRPGHEPESKGTLKLYNVWEFNTSDTNDWERALTKNDTSVYSGVPGFRPDLYAHDMRWAIDWEHYQRLGEKWDLRAEAHLYHDRDYLREYDESRYLYTKEPENSVDLRRLDKNWELEFVAQTRASNKWLDQSEYLPEVRLSVPGLRLGSLPLYLKQDLRVGAVDRRVDEDKYKYGTALQLDERRKLDSDPFNLSVSRLWDDDHYGTYFRAHNQTRLEAPIHLGGIATLTPWVEARTTYYGKTVGDPLPDYMLTPADYAARLNGKFTPGQITSDGDGKWNYAFPFGANLTTRTYTVFGKNDNWRWMFEPLVGYLENSRPHLDYDTMIYPIDEWDVYQRQRRFTVGAHNKLQRKDYEKVGKDGEPPIRDILDFSFLFHYFPRRVDAYNVNYDRKLSEIELDATYRPIANLSLSSNALWDIDDGTVNRFTALADWRLNEKFRVLVGQYYYRGGYWRYPESDASNETKFALRTKLWNDASHYALEGAMTYQWKDNPTVFRGISEWRLTLFRDLDTFEIALSYYNKRFVNDHGVFFQFSPKGFMGRDRPAPIYRDEGEDMLDGRYSTNISMNMAPEDVADADLKDIQY